MGVKIIEIKKKSQNGFVVVVVEEKGEKTQHIVNLDDDYYHLLTQGKIGKEELIRKSLQFLLEREPKESILFI
jgi:exoribonuclease R